MSNNIRTLNQESSNSDNSVVVKYQKQQHMKIKGNKIYICNIRYDDECRNGKNTFAITGEVWEKTRKRCTERNPDIKDFYIDDKWVWYDNVMGGCIHHILKAQFPEFKDLIQWHLCSSNSPMHYIANTTYFAKKGDLDSARKCAIQQYDESLSLEQLLDEDFLKSRSPILQSRFKKAMLDLGFNW